ncbi:MAG: ATP-binding protein [Armatimonadetes bacterium]|nr:ATP-binding protein [Armatimonadota bacterium]
MSKLYAPGSEDRAGQMGQEDSGESSPGWIDAQTEDCAIPHDLREYISKSGRMVALGELVAGITHNFANVLMSVSATLEALELEISRDPRYAHCVPVIAGALERVGSGAELTQRLLEFARHAPPQVGPVDLKKTADNAIALCRSHPKAKRVTIYNDIPEDAHPVRADAAQLEEILTNLALNALQASQEGCVRVGLGESDEAGLAVITVSDEGCGIAPEDLRQVFRPFFSRRGDGTSGTGLGLPCCLLQVSQMGGTIEVESVVGSGSTFNVKLPLWEE